MHLLSPETNARVADLFAAAMQADPLQIHFFPDPGRRLEQLRALYGFKVASVGGNIYASTPAMKGCAIWIPPGGDGGQRFRVNMLSPLLRLLRLVPFAAFGKMMHYDRFCRDLHHALIPAPHWYLDGIAVARQHQGKGHAGQLIRPILALADASGIPCYVETQNQTNVPIYARFGFRLLRAVMLPGTNVSHFAMLRP
jgi:GNAT superfamily N-acetyltransferase